MMRKVTQIAVEGTRLFALCPDGTVWTMHRKEISVIGKSVETGWSDWEFIEGPPEGAPGYKEPTLEEQAEKLRVEGGSQSFVGRGHPLSGKPGDKT